MILSLGYVLGQIPSNMITGYLRPSLYLCLMAVVWSGVSVAMCGTKDFTGLVLVRFFLGVVEAPLLPGAVYLMGCWYTRREMAMRVAILYTGQTLAYCASGLIAAAVFGTLDMVRLSATNEYSLDPKLTFTSRNAASLAGSGFSSCLLCVEPDLPWSLYGFCPTTHTHRPAVRCGP
jgi:MFS family permease